MKISTLTIGIALAGLAAAAVIVVNVNSPKPQPAVPVAPPEKPFATSLGATGLIEALDENTRIGAPVSGLVDRVVVKVWDRVRSGDPLFQLDDTELQARLGPQRAEVAVREARLADSDDLFARQLTLRKTAVASEQDFENARNAKRVAEAELRAARAAVAETQALIDRLTVRAPRDGSILQVNTRAGEYLSPDPDNPPVVLGAIEEVQVRAEVDEQVAPRLESGAKAFGFLKGDATSPIALEFVRIEPFVVPKKSLTGASSERVDTRVLQAIYKFRPTGDRPVYVGQQIDLFIEQSAIAASMR